jgi:hypothetical protein
LAASKERDHVEEKN